MYTTDVIVEEIKSRASRSIGPEGQLMKLAADDALRRLVTLGKIEIVPLEEGSWTTYDSAMQQLQSLAAAKNFGADETDTAERHGGEASAIAWSKQEMAVGTQVVFVTNDGDASTVAANHGIEVRHFGHALHELVCAKLLNADKAWGLYQRAVNVSGIPNSATFSSAVELACSGATNGCAMCAALDGA